MSNISTTNKEHSGKKVKLSRQCSYCPVTAPQSKSLALHVKRYHPEWGVQLCLFSVRWKVSSHKWSWPSWKSGSWGRWVSLWNLQEEIVLWPSIEETHIPGNQNLTCLPLKLDIIRPLSYFFMVASTMLRGISFSVMGIILQFANSATFSLRSCSILGCQSALSLVSREW